MTKRYNLFIPWNLKKRLSCHSNDIILKKQLCGTKNIYTLKKLKFLITAIIYQHKRPKARFNVFFYLKTLASLFFFTYICHQYVKNTCILIQKHY